MNLSKNCHAAKITRDACIECEKSRSIVRASAIVIGPAPPLVTLWRSWRADDAIARLVWNSQIKIPDDIIAFDAIQLSRSKDLWTDFRTHVIVGCEE